MSACRLFDQDQNTIHVGYSTMTNIQYPQVGYSTMTKIQYPHVGFSTMTVTKIQYGSTSLPTIEFFYEILMYTRQLFVFLRWGSGCYKYEMGDISINNNSNSRVCICIRHHQHTHIQKKIKTINDYFAVRHFLRSHAGLDASAKCIDRCWPLQSAWRMTRME